MCQLISFHHIFFSCLFHVDSSRGSSSGGSQVGSNGKIHGYLIVLGWVSPSTNSLVWQLKHSWQIVLFFIIILQKFLGNQFSVDSRVGSASLLVSGHARTCPCVAWTFPTRRGDQKGGEKQGRAGWVGGKLLQSDTYSAASCLYTASLNIFEYMVSYSRPPFYCHVLYFSPFWFDGILIPFEIFLMQEQWQFTLGRQGSQAFQIRRDAAAETQRSPAIQPIPRPNTSNPSRKYPKLRHFERKREGVFFFFFLYVMWYIFQAVTDVNQHTIFYTLPRHQAVIVEYTSDPTKDMYQVVLHFRYPLSRVYF